MPGLAIYDTMQYVKPDVRTICSGMRDVAWGWSLHRGRPGKRMALPNSKIMIHQGTAGFRGAPTDIEIQRRKFSRCASAWPRSSPVHSSRPLEAVMKDIDRDHFMSPEEAVEYGIVDENREEAERKWTPGSLSASSRVAAPRLAGLVPPRGRAAPVRPVRRRVGARQATRGRMPARPRRAVCSSARAGSTPRAGLKTRSSTSPAGTSLASWAASSAASRLGLVVEAEHGWRAQTCVPVRARRHGRGAEVRCPPMSRDPEIDELRAQIAERDREIVSAINARLQLAPPPEGVQGGEPDQLPGHAPGAAHPPPARVVQPGAR